MNIPNILSSARLLSVPFLFLLAWLGWGDVFIISLILVMLTDALDGYLARKWNQVTELGARLDSYGDLAIYLSLPVCLWLLWPEVIRRELVYVIAVVLSIVMPLIVGLLKFRTITSYHTWAVKISAVVVSFTVLLLFLGGPAWPFHLAVPVTVYAAMEQIMLSMLLSQPRSNIPSIWHLRRERMKG